MKTTCILATVLLVGCGGPAEPNSSAGTLPHECVLPTFEPSQCIDGTGGWRRCDASDGSRWVFYPPNVLDGGYEHVDAAGVRICRVWGSGAWAPGDAAADGSPE